MSSMIVNLASPSVDMSPAASLRFLADECDRLKIESRDVYGGGAPWLSDFEGKVAAFTRKEAALYVPSGTMAQQIALAVYREDYGNRESPFIAHVSSHLNIHEQDSYAHLLAVPALFCGVTAEPLDYKSVDMALNNHAEGGGSDPFALIVEVPHRENGGSMTSIEDLVKLRERCTEIGCRMHCDGARLFEALGGQMGGANKDVLLDAFDSIYISFYKGLGGMTGAMLAGNVSFINKSRVWLRRFGGNLYNNLPYAISGLSAIDLLGDTFGPRYETLQRYVHVIRSTATSVGASESITFWPNEVTCCMTHCHLKASPLHLAAVFEAAEQESGVKVCPRVRGKSYLKEDWSYFEWNVGPANMNISDEMVEKGWKSVFEHLLKIA
jgi:hypothetical protein